MAEIISTGRTIFDTCPDFAERYVLPLRMLGYTGAVIEAFPRRWWQLWKPKYDYAYWWPCEVRDQ